MEALPEWLLYGGGFALIVAAYLDIRKQNRVGATPTEFTKTVLERLDTVESSLLEERAENAQYREKARQWFIDASAAMRESGIEAPPPPDGFPV